MSANTVPRFIESPKTWQVKITASTPRVDATGAGATKLMDGATDASRIDGFRVVAETEVPDSLMYLFKVDGSGNTYVYDEISVSATSAGAGKDADFEAELTPAHTLYVLSGESVYAGLNTTTGTVNVFASGGDF